MKEFKTQEEIEEEITKCYNSPYYFATTYLIVKDHLGNKVPFKTSLSEEGFNEFIKITSKSKLRHNKVRHKIYDTKNMAENNIENKKVEDNVPSFELECTASEQVREESDVECEFENRDGNWWCTTHNCSA